MNDVVAETLVGRSTSLSTILNTHKPKCDRWLQRHPNVHFHLRRRTRRGLTRLNAGLAFCRVKRFAVPVYLAVASTRDDRSVCGRVQRDFGAV